MSKPADRVQLTKQESTAGGGDGTDASPFLTDLPVDTREDGIDTGGIFFQDIDDTPPDTEFCVIYNNGEEMYFEDSLNSASNRRKLDDLFLKTGVKAMTADFDAGGFDIINCKDIYVGGNVYHDGDTDTRFSFSTDEIGITVGGLKFAELTESVTDIFVINPDNNDLDFRVESTGFTSMLLVDASLDRVGIGRTTLSYTLDVNGDFRATNATLAGDIIHDGDADTKISFTDDKMEIAAGGVSFITITESTADSIVFNEGSADVDCIFQGSTDLALLHVNAGGDSVGVGVASPTEKFDVDGNALINGHLQIASDLIHVGDSNTKIEFTDDQIDLTAGGFVFLRCDESTADTITANPTTQDIDFVVQGSTDTDLIHTDASTNRVGISTATPGALLDVDGDAIINGDLTIPSKIIHSGDTDTYITFSAPDVVQVVAGGTNFLQFSSTSFPPSAVFNEGSANIDFRVEGNGQTNLFKCDASSDRVGINKSVPLYQFDVDGDTRISGDFRHEGSSDQIGFFGTTPASRPAAYTVSGHVEDRSYNEGFTSVTELARVLGTVIIDLQAYGLLA